MLGALLILVSTAAYNGSAVLLAVTARRHSRGPSLILSISRRGSGLLAILLNLLGWSLEVGALSLISLTLARVLSAAGLGILLVMTRRVLREPLGRRELLGTGFIALSVAAVGFAPPSFGGASPEPKDYALLLLILGPGIVLPYILRALRFQVSANLGATAAGLAYALSGVLTKSLADEIYTGSVLLLLMLAMNTLMVGLLGFDVELGALRDGYVSTVVPIVLALHTVVPIICAPLLFDEAWPMGLLSRALLGGGICFALLGTLLLSALSSHVLIKR